MRSTWVSLGFAGPNARLCSPAVSPGRSGLAAAALAAVLLAGLTALAPAPRAAAAECANQARRAEQGPAAEALPDCRAYEQVTAAGPEPYFVAFDTESNQSRRGTPVGAQAAADGQRLAFSSTFTPPAGALSNGGAYLSSRTPQGWASESIVPPQSTNNAGRGCYNAYPSAWGPELEAAVFADGWGQEGHPFEATESNCATDEPSLVPGEPEGFQNLFLRDTEARSYALLNTTPPAVEPNNAFFQDASQDLGAVFFDSEASLTPEAPAGDDLYVSSGGAVRLLTFLPDGTPVQGSLADASVAELLVESTSAARFTNAVSADGSHAFFSAAGNLYLRENPTREPTASGECTPTEAAKACTLQVDESKVGGPGGGGIFQWASADGETVYFTDAASAELTADTVPASGQNLYRLDLASGQLTDLTPVAEAGVLGASGLAAQGAGLYFVSEADLTGPQQNSEEALAQAGHPNLYLAAGSDLTYIATLDAGADALDWNKARLTARTSPDGEYLAFNSTASLTGYDNTGPCIGEELETGPCQEIFLYSAAQNRLSCVSCNPAETPPSAPARIYRPLEPTISIFYNAPTSLQRFLSDSGRVFFNTADALLPADRNEVSDVYEFEQGELHLISPGEGDFPAYFYEATPSGEDAYFITAQPLLRSDTDGGINVYDARVGGGFAQPPEPVICSAEDCRAPAPTPPSIPAASTSTSTSTFSGPGNPKPLRCRHGKVRRHGKCVKRTAQHKKRHARQGKHHRPAGKGEGGGK